VILHEVEIMTVAKAHTFGRYRVTKTLGTGAMGEVFEAIDDVLGREVAIKTLRSETGIAARFIDDRFRNEARAIAQFSHPGVVQVFDIDLSAEPPYLVMERVSGPALSERLSSGPLPVTELVPLGIQIARALAAAHSAGVVHRDVKPSNILGAGAGGWKLADFGVAHVPDSSLTMTGQFIGSPAYAAPEALVKGVSAPTGDVYGLGATLYEAAAGKWPRKEAQGALLAPVPPLLQLAPHVPAHVAAAIDRAVSLEADQRPTANELADLLASVHHEPRAPRALRWQPWAVVGAIVLLVIIVIAMRGDKKSAPALGPSLPAAAALPDWCEVEQTDGRMMIRPPPTLTDKSGRDWEKIMRKIYERDYEKAAREVDHFEEKWGARDETTCVRAQIERLAEQEPQNDER
jgi:tRNA A-37 threonylcarbamoyl transferase component Bud32